MNSKIASFKELDPDLVLKATETSGCQATGLMTQLNSYENRVFEVGIESSNPREKRVIKFYRPGRWSRECILEEHSFLKELQDNDIHVGFPLPLFPKQSEKGFAPAKPSTLLELEGLYYAVFPRVRGRLPDEFRLSELRTLGRILGRLHNIGAQKKFIHRPILHEAPFSLWDNLDILSPLVSVELWPRYEAAAVALIDAYEDQIDPSSFQRIHGDFHRGNTLLFTDTSVDRGSDPNNSQLSDSFILVDFDDCCTGPVVQDFWMLLGSEDDPEEVNEILMGYEEFRAFPHEQLEWIPLLRGARILSYAAWIARRWSDPSFLKLFPEFGSHRYWSIETEALERIVYSRSFDGSGSS